MNSQDQHSLECLLEEPVGIRCDANMMPSCLDLVKQRVLFITDIYIKLMEVYMCSNGRYYMLECYKLHGSTHRILYSFIEVEHKMKIVDYYVPLQEANK